MGSHLFFCLLSSILLFALLRWEISDALNAGVRHRVRVDTHSIKWLGDAIAEEVNVLDAELCVYVYV